MTRTPSNSSSQGSGQRPEPTWLARVNLWLTKQGELVSSLEAMVPVGERLAREGDREALDRHLDQRERVLRELEREQAAVEPELRDWDMCLADLDSAQRQLLTQRVEAVASRVAGLLAAGARDQRTLESRRDALAEEIESLSKGRGAANAYAGRGASGDPSRYQDHEA